MKNKEVAVLLTSHNRKEKTLACLDSFYAASFPEGYVYDVYLVDDGSTDGTSNEVKSSFSDVNIIQGDGSLFWAGGMRLAWQTAIDNNLYDAFILLNDDVILNVDFINNLIKTNEYSLSKNGKTGIYSAATIDDTTERTTYGAYKIKTNHLIVRNQLLSPKETPQECELTNANILWISKETVDAIGLFDTKYTHGFADFDYSLSAVKKNIPVYLAPNFGGVCIHDHGNPWRSSSVSLKNRIAYLKSPKGLAYKEYLYYVKKHFPLFLPYSFFALWLKTFFPFLWERFKK